MNQIKAALEAMTGARFPVKITLSKGDSIVRYIRGFADPHTSIVLISETSYSLSMSVLEVKDIAVLEYAFEQSAESWVTVERKK